jgi:hypothetical protein
MDSILRKSSKLSGLYPEGVKNVKGKIKDEPG